MPSLVPLASARSSPPPPPFCAGAEMTWRHPHILTHRSERFGELCAELFACEANDVHELEVSASTHSLIMRCDGVASRWEVEWPDEGRRINLAELRRGSILFTPAFSTVRSRKRDHGRFSSLVVQIPAPALERLDGGGAAAQLNFVPQAGSGDAELCRVLTAMYEEMEAAGPAGLLYKETLGVQLLVQLLRRAANLVLAPTKGGLAGWQLRRTVELIEADLAHAPSLNRLADEVGLSPSHFCTAFRQSTGLPPHKYLLRRRIIRAKYLMVDRKLSLTEIALNSGFASSSQFATTFRRIEGMTPTAYRRAL